MGVAYPLDDAPTPLDVRRSAIGHCVLTDASGSSGEVSPFPGETCQRHRDPRVGVR